MDEDQDELHDEYNDGNRAFLQAFLARGTMTFEESRHILAAIFRAQEDEAAGPNQITQEDFDSYVSAASAAVSPFDLEIRSTMHQTRKERIYAIVNTTSDPMTQLATLHSADEIAFVKRVIDAMFEKYNTPRIEALCLDEMQANKLRVPPRPENEDEDVENGETQNQAPKGLKSSEVETVMRSMVDEGWFERSRDGFYCLSPRALLELRSWLLESYNDPDAEGDEWQRVKFCEACKDVVTIGQRCAERDCLIRLHDNCADAFFRTRRERACPKCKEEWTGRHFVGERAVTETEAYQRGRRRSGKGSRHSNLKVKKHREQKAAEKDKSEKEKGKEKQAAPEIVKDGTPLPTADTASGVPAASPSPSFEIVSSNPGDGDGDDVSIDGTPVLDHEDEKFLERLTASDASLAHSDANEDENPPPLPPRVKTPVIDIDSDDASSICSRDAKSKQSNGKGKHESSSSTGDDHKPKRFSFVTNLSRNISLRRKPAPDLHPDHLAVPSTSGASKEETELARVLDDLDLSAKNNRAFSLSSESADMARRFTQVLKDLVNGVPTAYGDLVALLDDRDGVLARTYEKLPSSLKKLVAHLPEKLTSSLAPELLAAAAEAQGLKPGEGRDGGLKGAAKTFLTPANLHDLVTKPGALVGLLKGIVNALKTRFPAFVGTNVLWSLAVFLLLSMLWYCYKRGREVRLEREASDAAAAAAAAAAEANPDDDEIEGRPRVEELPDDPMLAAAAPPAADAARESANTT
ncbi:Nse1 non-SMC component of SMC5-6 complex-domain-containing protein [Ustulina deusta]|nr:Nse1 non-SMC component of SMC5-6 complex-domain-containing protein [Ustulina deusta]